MKNGWGDHRQLGSGQRGVSHRSLGALNMDEIKLSMVEFIACGQPPTVKKQ